MKRIFIHRFSALPPVLFFLLILACLAACSSPGRETPVSSGGVYTGSTVNILGEASPMNEIYNKGENTIVFHDDGTGVFTLDGNPIDITYVINGILAGIAGVIFMSRVNAGLPNGAVGYEMEGLTATIVGGTSFSGGIGTTMGTLAGAFIIGFLNNIMNLNGVDSYVQQMVKGLIIAVAVVFDIRSKSRKTRKVILVEDDKKEK